MTVGLFAGIPVGDLARAVDWWERVLGVAVAFRPNDVEAVREVAEHRFLYVELLPAHAGHARVTAVVDDLDARVEGAATRGIEPVLRETYDNGVGKVAYRDPDGNEFGLGGAPAT